MAPSCPDEAEEALEAELESAPRRALRGPGARPGQRVGRYRSRPGGSGPLRAVRHLRCLEGRRLDGLRVALDCANGAAFLSAPAVFEAAGAQLVAVLAAEPDGTNINDKLRLDRPSPAGRDGGCEAAPTSGWPSTATPTG